MSAATTELITKQVHENPSSLLCFPSGDTPTGMLQRLVEQSNLGNLDFGATHFVGLDEWVGMDKHDEGSCQHYMFSQFFEAAKIKASQITFFDAKASDLANECRRVDDVIRKRGSLDMIVVGVGINGHIGLNEPGTPFDSYCHASDLAESTKTVGQKYFTSATPLTKGITVGLKHMMEAKGIVVIASGEKKSAIIQQIVEGPVTEDVPASILQRHPNAILVLDEAAASRLKKIS
jgi:glucosamine-6-phosphate deaminase